MKRNLNRNEVYYEGKINEVRDLSRLERIASSWQMMLSKFTTKSKDGLVKEKKQLHLSD